MTWLIRKIKKFSRKKKIHQFRWMRWNLIDHCLKDGKKKNGTYTWIIWSKQKSHWLRLLLLFQNYIFACLVHNDDKTFETHAHSKSVCTLMYSFWCVFFVGDKIAFYSLQSILVAISFVSPIFSSIFFSFFSRIYLYYIRAPQSTPQLAAIFFFVARNQRWDVMLIRWSIFFCQFISIYAAFNLSIWYSDDVNVTMYCYFLSFFLPIQKLCVCMFYFSVEKRQKKK